MTIEGLVCVIVLPDVTANSGLHKEMTESKSHFKKPHLSDCLPITCVSHQVKWYYTVYEEKKERKKKEFDPYNRKRITMEDGQKCWEKDVNSKWQNQFTTENIFYSEYRSRVNPKKHKYDLWVSISRIKVILID